MEAVLPYTLDAALEDDLVTVVQRDDGNGHYVIRLGALEPDIEIQLRPSGKAEQMDFKVSHAIRTPGQEGPYHSSSSYGDAPANALRHAVSGLTMSYRQAVKNGHTPVNDWLVKY